MKLKHFALLFFIGASFASTCYAGHHKKDEHKSQKTISLFNGKNFDGWYVISRKEGVLKAADEKYFKVKKGGIIHVYPTQKDGSEQSYAGLITHKSYSRYKLSLEYKWGKRKFIPRADRVRDAGVLFHVHGPDIIWPLSVEMQIQEGDTGDIWAIGTRVTSKINSTILNYDPNGEPVTRGSPDTHFSRFHRSYSWDIPGWNKIEIIVDGDHAKYYANGQLVNEAIDMKYWDSTRGAKGQAGSWKKLEKGKILIQAEGAELFYRNIELTPL